jgi:hypothetical protein
MTAELPQRVLTISKLAQAVSTRKEMSRRDHHFPPAQKESNGLPFLAGRLAIDPGR